MERNDFNIAQESIDEFNKLLEKCGKINCGSLMNAVVVDIISGYVIVDVGMKSEGRIPKEEFTSAAVDLPAIGDNVTVLLESMEDNHGDIVLSYSKALRESSWSKLEELYHRRVLVNGYIARKVQGGFAVNLGGVSAFLPKATIPATIADVKELYKKQLQFVITRMDRAKSVITVSLRAAAGEEEVAISVAEGQIVEGVVKSLTESVAFIDLNGTSARLPVGEISWTRIKDPAEVLKVGDTIKVKVSSISQSNRVTVSLRDLTENPWVATVKAAGIEEGQQCEGKIKGVDGNVMFIELPGKIEARMRVSDVAWIKNEQSFDEFKANAKINVKVLTIDGKRSAVYVSLKHLQENPFVVFAQKHQVGEMIDCTMIQDLGLSYLMRITDEISGVVLKDEVSGVMAIGEKVKLCICNISAENCSVMLGSKKDV